MESVDDLIGDILKTPAPKAAEESDDAADDGDTHRRMMTWTEAETHLKQRPTLTTTLLMALAIALPMTTCPWRTKNQSLRAPPSKPRARR